MQPAFGSTRQAAAFAFLLLMLLLLPAVMSKSMLPPREQIYSSIWWANGAFPYIDQQIFAEKGDIDIAFIGASHIWNGIDTPYVQEQLSEKLGRPAVVRSLCWGGAGYDALYFITKDLLEHRRVHMIVFYDVYNQANSPNPQATHWFRFGDDAGALDGLSLPLKATYYFAAIIGMPRNLLGLVRPNLPIDPLSPQNNYWNSLAHAEDIFSNLGALTEHAAFSPDPVFTTDAPFEPYTPQTAATSSDVRVYSDATKDAFRFSSAVPSWQLHFARKFAGLAEEHQSKLVLLHMPLLDEKGDAVIPEREFWPEALKAPVAMVGIPPAKLFFGLTNEQIDQLYSDTGHFNKNGQDYFTALITPSLLDLYATPTSR